MFLVLTDSGSLRYCLTKDRRQLECRDIASDVNTVTSTDDGVWYSTKDGGLLSFVEFITVQPNSHPKFKENDYPIRAKYIISTIYGDVYAILLNGTTVKLEGISAVRPSGSGTNWKVLPVSGKRVIGHPDGILVETNGGQLVKQGL